MMKTYTLIPEVRAALPDDLESKPPMIQRALVCALLGVQMNADIDAAQARLRERVAEMDKPLDEAWSSTIRSLRMAMHHKTSEFLRRREAIAK